MAKDPKKQPSNKKSQISKEDLEDKIVRLSKIWYEYVGMDHHKDRDCHFRISQHSNCVRYVGDDIDQKMINLTGRPDFSHFQHGLKKLSIKLSVCRFNSWNSSFNAAAISESLNPIRLEFD